MATTTKFWTWTQIYAKMVRELDLDGEDIVNETEMMEFANDAIDEAEAEIHQMNASYFVTKDGITLVSGTDEYAQPASIYASKFTALIYRNGSRIYNIERITSLEKFLEYQAAIAAGETSLNTKLRYFLFNTTAGTPKIMFTPPVMESGAYVTAWFYRNANRLESGADICDIPEFVRFVFDYIRERVWWKIRAGSPKHQDAKEKLEATRGRMRLTLQGQVVDGAAELQADPSHYEDHL